MHRKPLGKCSAWSMNCKHRGPSSTVTVRVVESKAVCYLLMFSDNMVHLPGSEKYKI